MYTRACSRMKYNILLFAVSFSKEETFVISAKIQSRPSTSTVTIFIPIKKSIEPRTFPKILMERHLISRGNLAAFIKVER